MGGALPRPAARGTDGDPDYRERRRFAHDRRRGGGVISLYMAAYELEHPALDQVGATPEILRILMASVTDEIAVKKPGPGRWSLAEVLEHLSHVEGHVFRARVDLILAQEGAEVEPYDEKELDAAGT